MPIVIEPWREGWADDYAALRDGLLTAAPATAVLHHIGSTSVPGLAAKNVIDMQLSVDSLDALDIDAIAALGFTHRSGLIDHCPAGLTLDAAELRKHFFKGTDRAVHLHVREKGRFNQRFALLCRDFLRSHAMAASAYAEIKRELAARFADDEDAYYAIKDPVFDIIVAGAEEWAERIGWTEPPGD